LQAIPENKPLLDFKAGSEYHYSMGMSEVEDSFFNQQASGGGSLMLRRPTQPAEKKPLMINDGGRLLRYKFYSRITFTFFTKIHL